MSVTTTSLGTNTKQITLSGETSSANFITALDTALTGMGWSQLDVSNQYYRVYNSTNLDGTTSKIIAIQIDPANFRIYTTSWESWNATTHVGTNEVYTWNRTGMMGYALSNCDVIVMASSRWCVLQTFIRNQASCWSGVFELMREPNEDTASAGYPCWCWTSSALVFTCPTAYPTVAPTVSVPRTRGGLTGSAAATNNSFVTPLTRIGATGANPPAQLGSSLPTFTTYGWNVSKKMTHPVRLLINGTELHGRVFGLKMTYNIGNQYNVASLTVDSNYNYSVGGTATNHWVLQANPTTATANVFNSSSNGTGYTTLQTAALGGIQYSVAVGTGFYCTTNAGLYYIDASGASLGTPTVVSGVTGNCMHVVYDGSQYVFVASTVGVFRIDTLNSNAVTTITGTSSLSLSWLAWDGTYVWAVPRATGANLSVYQINPSGTINGTYALGNASSTISDICVDNSGNAYVVFAGNGAVYKVTSTGTVTTFTTLANIGVFGGGAYFNGQYLIFTTITNASYCYVYQYLLTGTLVTSSFVGLSTGVSSTTYLKTTIAKVGIYDVVATGTNSTNTMMVTQLLPLNYPTTGGSINGSGLAVTINALTCDGNRAYATLPGSNTFYYWTNLFHPDELSTTYGRLLLPQ